MSHEIFQFIGMRRHNGILNKTFLLDKSTAMTKDKTELQTPATIVLHEFYKLINARTKKNKESEKQLPIGEITLSSNFTICPSLL